MQTFKDKKELEKIILVKVPTEVILLCMKPLFIYFNQAGIKNISIA